MNHEQFQHGVDPSFGVEKERENEYDWQSHEPTWITERIRNNPSATREHRNQLEDMEELLNRIAKAAKEQGVRFEGEKDKLLSDVIGWGEAEAVVSPKEASDLGEWYASDT